MQGIITVALLTISNIFMTFAWYGHLRFKSSPIWEAILFSWLIASLEYCFQVPANRIGSYQFSTAQLKITQEVITLIVFSVFSVFYLKEQLRWNYLVAFVFIIAAVFFVFIDLKEPHLQAMLNQIKIGEKVSVPGYGIQSKLGTRIEASGIDSNENIDK
jgi:uncharacterized protein